MRRPAIFWINIAVKAALIGLLLFAWAIVSGTTEFQAFVNAHGIAIVVGGVTAAIQIPLTGALTLGWFGLPAFGIRGPAIAAVIAFALAALWMLSKLTGDELVEERYAKFRAMGAFGEG